MNTTCVLVSNLKNLMVLDLSYNHLTGAIPSSLANLHFLSEFNISYNDLEGPVPVIGHYAALCFCTHCNSAEASPVSIISTKQYIDKVVFAVALGLLFGVGTITLHTIPAYLGKSSSQLIQTMKPHSSRSNKTSRFRINFFDPAFVLLLTFISPVNSCTEQERHSLLRFLAGLSQDSGLAASWQNSTDCCTWEGIICGEDGAVTEISLASRGLQGRISLSLRELTSLSRLNLSYNLLSGGLPSELISTSSIVVLDVSFNRLDGELQELNSSSPERPLQVLNISSNLFTGAFPSTTWEKTSSLFAINASNNSFTGYIPSTFCISSSSFAVLDLSYNQFSGNIPHGIGKCCSLRMLKVGHNNIIGTLPYDLFSAISLEYLSFANNGLQGTINGALIIKLRNLVFVDLGWNRFSGKIPDSIGQLKKLEELHMCSNNLSGELPSSLGECTNLVTINLRSNKLEGELAKVNFSNLHNLKKIDFGSNNFTGTIPESIYSCSNLTWLRLSSNRLHGQLTKNIGNLKSITFLSLSYNNFTNITNTLHILKSLRNLNVLLIGGNFKNEAMPQDEAIDGFENILCLAIEDCALSGKIPNWFSKLRNLQILVLHNNQLNGPIPTWTSSLKFLKYVDISNNNLTGEIPAGLMEMAMLKSDKVADNSDPIAFPLPYHTATALPKMLNLGNNKFTGAIPMEIGELKALVSLNLSFNNLNSEIPQSMNNLKNLMVLDLSYNHLTGAIPPALMNLHFLSKFNVSYNDLEGPVPIGGQFSTFPSSSFAGNPKLCSPMLLHHCNSAEEDLSSSNSTKDPSRFGRRRRFGTTTYGHSCVDGGGGGSAGRRAMARLVFNVAEAPVGFGVGVGVGGWMTGEPMSLTNMSRTRVHFPSGPTIVGLMKEKAHNGTKNMGRIQVVIPFRPHDSSLTMSWRNNTDCCTWDGIICSMDGAVTELLLSSRGLEGQISPSLGELTSLSRLNLSYNSLSGGLPVELMSSSSIIVLDVCFNRLGREVQELNSSVLNISSNRFTGDFPSTTWEKMRNLVVINASNNSFTGYIPSSFCISSPSFTVLDLSYNRFSGNIPPGIGNCSALKMFKAGYNNISGTLPDELFDAISLEYLSFPNNGLQGRIDGTHLIKLKNLATLDLRWNQLTGKIPDSINQLKQLEELHLCSNMMSGELPGKLGSCTNLKVIDLKHNNFYGDLGKVDFSALHNLRTLDLYLNNFTGTIPVSIYSCRNLKALRTMTTLLIGRNFRGEIMPQDENIDGFGNLQVLDISGCLLSGNIPQWISRLKNLEMLILSANRLTGPIPGEISPIIGQLEVHVLDFSFNNLSGKIPQSICNLTNLQVIHLSNNHLTDAIPPGLSNLHFLSAFNVSNNDLEGPIPTGGQFDTFPDSSFRGNPKICSPIVARRCNSTEEALTSPISTKQYIDKTVFVIAFGVSFGVGVTSLKLCSDLKYSHYSKAYSVAPQSPAPSKMNTPKENLIGQLVICQRDSVNAVYAPKSRKLGRN
uniref:non-specific serine/threonine protein kinase n=1 Tax=Oryza nivara TaxID=4536 RepID=A0A0E0G1G0_ORYNI